MIVLCIYLKKSHTQLYHCKFWHCSNISSSYDETEEHLHTTHHTHLVAELGVATISNDAHPLSNKTIASTSTG